MSRTHEKFFTLVKPDGVKRKLIGDIISRFEKKNFQLVALKILSPSETLVRKHYGELSSEPFFCELVKYIASGPVVVMVWEGYDAVASGRKIIGSCCVPGSIRGDLSQFNTHPEGQNVIHGADSVESSNKEISLWFSDEEIVTWNSATLV